MSIWDAILGIFGGGKKPEPAKRPAPAAPPPKPAAAPAPKAAAPVPARSIDRVLIGEALVGDGNEIAHIDLIIGPRGSAAERAFANALANNKDGFTTLLAVVAPNLAAKPNAVMFNKVTIKGAKQAVQMFGPAQRAVAMAVTDCVADGTIPEQQANDLYLSVGVFIHWLAEDDNKIQDYNYEATKLAIKRAVAGEPKVQEVLAKARATPHPFAAHS
ncbi:MAG: formaldehyde-activating enzyme [Burkholderiales bacterium]|nr:formaldehyde-activating enzyme [Burkholderiales bacterium]